MPGVESYLTTHRKAALVVLAMLGVTGVSGYFMGLRQTQDFSAQSRAARASAYADREKATGSEDAPLAVSYSQLASAGFSPNTGWTNSLANLPTAPDSRQPAEPLTADQKLQIIADRADRRAYNGAPPVVPHPVDQLSSQSCLSCHGPDATLLVAGTHPPRMSHGLYSSCTQCHVPTKSPQPKLTATGFGLTPPPNTFAGKPRSGPGTRAYPGAPQTIPHPTFMRENCTACHGAGKPHALTTPHLDRQSCTQCHAAPSPAR